MFEKLNRLDTDALLFLNGFHKDWMDEIMFWVSNDKIWIAFYLMIIFFLFRVFDWRQALIAVVCIISMVTCSDRISSGYFKPVFKRFRPTHEKSVMQKIHTVHDYKGGDYGFISSHAANTFGLAMFLFLLLHKYKRNVGWMFFWAGIVSYSRIYLGVHYPLDILSGALLGIFLAILFYRIYLFFLKLSFKPGHISS